MPDLHFITAALRKEIGCRHTEKCLDAVLWFELDEDSCYNLLHRLFRFALLFLLGG